MPLIVEDVACLGAAGFVYWRVAAGQEGKRKARVAVAKRLAEKRFSGPVDFSRCATKAGTHSLRAGADSNAVAAMDAVQAYLDKSMSKSGKPGDSSSQAPSCSYGFFKMTGCTGGPPTVEVEVGVCEELKFWLLGAASGAASADEVATRLEFYRELMMRPENFVDSDFLRLLACVCEQLDNMGERFSGSVRTCSLTLTKILSLGISLIDSTMPLLLLGITDTMEDGSLPLISTQGLIQSASHRGKVKDAWSSVWDKDHGKILAELLLTQHFKTLYGCAEPADSGYTQQSSETGRVTEKWLELRHKWMDALAEGHSWKNSGLSELFQGQESSDVQQDYLNLYKQLDNLAKFLTIFETFKALADIGGDAGMYSLRSSIHHLLEEIDQSVQVIFQTVSSITGHIMTTVIDVTKGDWRVAKRRRTWLERLQQIDVTSQSKIYKAIISASSELRYLTCEARMPHLQASCQQALLQIAAVLQSAELKDRCIEPPPDISALADQSQSLMMLPAGQPQQRALQDSPPWSVTQQVSASLEEVQGLDEASADSGRSLIIHKHSKNELGIVVEELNQGRHEDAGNAVVVHVEESDEYIALYKDESKDAAVAALGLNARPWRSKTEEGPFIEEVLDSFEEQPQQLEGDDEQPQHHAVAAATVDNSWPATVHIVDNGSHPSNGGTVDNSAAVEERPAAETVPESAAVPEEAVPASVAVSEEEQKLFYDRLFMAVLPALGKDAERLTKEETLKLLQRSDLPDATLNKILTLKVGSYGANIPKVDAQVLQALGSLVAHAQAGRDDFKAAQGSLPASLPKLRGIIWNKAKKKVQVTEDL